MTRTVSTKFRRLASTAPTGPKHHCCVIVELNKLGIELIRAQWILELLFCCSGRTTIEIRQRSSNPSEYQFWFSSERKADMARAAFLGYRMAFETSQGIPN